MKTVIRTAAIMWVLAGSAYAGGLEGAVLGADNAFYGAPALMKEFLGSPVPPAFQAAMRRPPFQEEIPYHCPALPVVYERNGRLYVGEGKELGSSPNRWVAACTGDVLWTNTSGRLYRNTRELGNAQSFTVAVKTGDVAWTDSYGTLRKNETELGKADSNSQYQIGSYTGIVVWKNWYGELFRDSTKLGHPGSNRPHEMARYTGDVVWIDSYGRLYRNEQQLGDIGNNQPQIADRTGDVGWEDGYRRLYKNRDQVTQDFDFWEMRLDGLLIWRDRWGNYHSR